MYGEVINYSKAMDPFVFLFLFIYFFLPPSTFFVNSQIDEFAFRVTKSNSTNIDIFTLIYGTNKMHDIDIYISPDRERRSLIC